MNAYTLHTYKSYHEIQGQVKATLLYEEKKYKSAQPKDRGSRAFSCQVPWQVHISCTPEPHILQWGTMTQKTPITNFLKYYKEFLPLLFYLQGQLFYLQFMESQLLWRIQQYTLKLKSYTFSSPYFLISFSPKPKEIPRNRNTKRKPKTPIYNSTPHNSK